MQKREQNLRPKFQRLAAAGWVAAIAAACGVGVGSTPILGSESHFLSHCNGECGGGFDCIQGICTRSCATGPADCSSLGSFVECMDPSTELDESAICDVRCSSAGDCSALGAGYQCLSGFCRYTGTNLVKDVNPECTSPELVKDNVTLRNQAEVDALEGCTTVYGGLDIQAFEGADLRPLSALTTVHGMLRIGDPYSEFPMPAFPSLEGLESVREVEELNLRGVLAPSLLALSGLRTLLPRLGPESRGLDPRLTGPGPESGLVIIGSCSELTDLRGLENLVGVLSLVVNDNAKLSSLEGIRIPAEIDQLQVWDSPLASLAGLEALTTVREVLYFKGTSLTSLQGLEQLARVGEELSVYRSPNFVDLSAIQAIESLGSFNLMENASLEVVPELPNVSSLGLLYVFGNPSLVELPAWRSLSRVDVVQIGQNAALERVETLRSTQSIRYMDVTSNPSLVELDLNALDSVSEHLRIAGNPALEAASIRMPSKVAAVTIGGNRGDAVLLDPCPWPRNGHCEGPPYFDLCAPGTDPECYND